MDLFEQSSKESKITPLAERVRPNNLSGFLGQGHILSANSLIHQMIQSKTLRSMILWGPPGSGKTTLAHIIAEESNTDLFPLNAISSGVQDVRKVIEKGKVQARQLQRQVILFIDEIHRFNKSQQDSLLEAVETGNIVLIGATTENPSFQLNAPLISRCQVFKLQSHSNEDIKKLIQQVLEEDIIIKTRKISLSKESEQAIIDFAGGDARKALNLLEQAVSLSKSQSLIELEQIQDILENKLPIYDRAGDAHYDVISAFIKSMRGSSPDAAVYYLAVMLSAGEDIAFIARRMVIFASEDIGNADPQAMVVATSCLTSVQQIGMPEARIILSQTASYLASAPKSNACYLAIDKAMEHIKKYGYEVPLHIRNAPTKLMKEFNYGKGYQYPHNFPQHFVKENYLPESVNETFYEPGELGYEKKLKAWLEHLWKKND